ncbi:hypothetical protein GYMLUDRAFT_74349 [Collybiopsis luxurians FD-317 M1]|uniref:Uncharacterized protein n=1 Tax=Collybiopsis luxurians FD-317 M1 TaxID=944289 RepID=A0A0D0B8K9_9AGAR|nr:hypothetical protein GYMLUDRAFT_74349 [Collybiopsis luxurians FD-317 M1]
MSFLRIFSSQLATARSPVLQSSSKLLCRLLTVSTNPPNSDAVWQAVDHSTNRISKALTDQRYAAAKGQNIDDDSPEAIWLQQSKVATKNFANIGYLNNNPYYGRSVDVIDGDIGGAFRRLDSILTRNMVRKQLKLTERHEKKGPKRRRLESERWRRLFAHEVRKNVQLVTKIRKRGA